MENKAKNDALFKKAIKKYRSYFPLLYSSPNRKYKKKKTSGLTKRNRNLYNSINETFIKRNYSNYMEKINSKKMFYNSNIISKNDLDSILYKLKQNYNLITTITQKRNLEIEKLNTNLETEKEKLKKIIDFQEIELPEEKISLKKIGDTKMTKEELEIHLRKLVGEKRLLDEKVFIANQYSKTVQYMLDEEKKKVLSIQDETNQIQEKLNNFKRYHNLICDNLNKIKLKNNNYIQLNDKLQNDIDLANKIIHMNNEKNEKIENRIVTKEEKMNNLKKKILSIKETNQDEFDNYTEGIYEKIIKSKEDEEEKSKKEKDYVNIIYCLYILQQFFIEQENFDFDKLFISKEYKAIINENYEIDTNKQEKNVSSDNNKGENNDLNLEELKKMFKKISLKKETLFNYISKLSSRISFNKNCLNNFHLKEISLIEKRENYIKKVKNIINEDYINFIELSKTSSKFKTFLDKNKSFMEDIKNKNMKDNLKEINKQLNLEESEKINNKTKLNINGNNMKNNINAKPELNKEQTIINAKELYKKANELIISHNNFLDNMSNILNEIIISVQYINNNNEKKLKGENENEKDNINSKNNISENKFVKSLQENYDNIINFQKYIKKSISNSSNNFIKYIKELIEYNKKNIKEKLNEDELNNNLLSLFYKDNNNQKDNINDIFFNHFISKNITNENIIFNHFYKFANLTHGIIKSNISFLKKNKKLVDDLINKNSNIPTTKSISLSKKVSPKNNLDNYDSSQSLLNFQKTQDSTSTPIFKKIKMKKKRGSINRREKGEDYNSLWVEDKETSSDTETVKKEEKIFKRKINFIERNIVNNLYRPTFEKSDYLRKLNSNMKNIKNMTLNYSKFNFIMNKKRNEIDLIGHQMLLYNNPQLHPDELSSPIYNNINSLMINRKVFDIKNNNEKRFRSTFTSRRHKIKF